MSSPAISLQNPGAGSPIVNINTPQGLHTGSPFVMNAASPSTAFLLQQQQQFLQGGHIHISAKTPAGASPRAGSTISLSGTTADAPNEFRKLIRALLEEGGQGRFSLERINQEVQGLLQEVNSVLAAPPHSLNTSARLMDLLATLDELQIQLARSGLGAVPIIRPDQSNDTYNNVQGLIQDTATTVQNNFKARQKIKDGSGVAKTVLKF